MNSLAAQTWLILRNDLRLLWRDLLTGKMRMFSSFAFIGFLFVLLNAVSILVFVLLHRSPPLVAETIAWSFFAFVMLGAAMNHAISVLFERADFDLLLSSPVSPRAILLARLSAMTVGAALSAAMFVVPLLNGATIGASAHYLWGYLVWWLLAATVASAGVWGTLLLVRWLGPRRARTWAQVIAAVLGATLYLGFQSQNLMPREMRGVFAAKMMLIFGHPALTIVARAGRGEWPALLTLTALAGAFALLTTRLLARLFVTGIQEAGGIKPQTRRHGRYRFVERLDHATFRKDVRLILRDPLLLSKLLPSVLYIAPLIFSIGRFGNAGAPGFLAPFCVLLATTLAAQLTGIAASGEEGWDLIRLSPASTTRLRLAKITVGLALPVSLCGVVAIAIALLGRPGLALMALVTAIVCASAVSWFEVAVIRPTPRKDLIQRGGRVRPNSPLRIIASVLFLLAGAGGMGLAAHGQWLLAIGALGVVAITALMCFTLVEMEDIEFEAAAPSSTSYAPADPA